MGLHESNSTSSYLYALSSNIFDNSAEDLYFINELQKYIFTTNTNEHHKRNTDTNYFRLSVLFFTNIIFKNEHVHLFTEMSQSIPNL